METSSKGPWRVTARLVVSITGAGLHIQQQLENQPTRLRFADLVLLSEIDRGDVEDLGAALADVASRTSTDVTELHHVAAQLEAGKRLARGAQRRSIAPARLLPAKSYSCPPSPLELLTPVSFRLVGGGFETLGHDGERIALLEPAELHALSQLAEFPEREQALAAHTSEAAVHALGEDRFIDLLGRFAEHGLIQRRDTNDRDWGFDIEAMVGGDDTFSLDN